MLTTGPIRVLICCVVAVGLAGTSLASAQVTADMAQGQSPLGVYQVGNIDNVNVVNGNVSLRIPLLSYPQRGYALGMNFYIFSNDKKWYITDFQETTLPPTIYSGEWGGPVEAGGQVPQVGAYVGRDQDISLGQDMTSFSWFGGTPGDGYTITTQFFGNYVLEADGTKHYIGDNEEQTCQSQGGGTCPSTYGGYGGKYPATDGSLWAPGTSGWIAPSTAISPQGNQYTTTISGTSFTTTETDTNGNTVTASTSGWVDSLGRSFPGSITGPGGITGSEGQFAEPIVPGVALAQGQIGNCPGGTSAARQWVVPAYNSTTQTYYLCYESFSYQTAFDIDTVLNTTAYSGVSETSSSSPGYSPALLLSAVVLPNGTSYTFSYDQYLSLTRVTLPTGGSISYTWQNVPFGAGLGVPNSPLSRAVATRTVTPGNGQPSEIWTYHWYVTLHYNTEGGVSYPSVTYPVYAVVTDPAGNDQEHQLGGDDDSGTNYNGLYETKVASYVGCSPHDTASNRTCSPSTGTLLKTESYILAGAGSGGANLNTPSVQSQPPTQPGTITTTWTTSSGQNFVSRKVITPTPEYGSCQTYGGLNEEPTGDYSAPTYNTTSPCYSTNQPQTTAYYDYGPGSPGSLLKSVATNYEWQPGNGNAYQTANLMNLPSSVVTDNASGTRLAETDYSYDQSPSCSGARGNLTTTSRWLNTGSASASTAVYNCQGMATSTTDPNLNQTTYAYDSTGAFLQSVTDPSVYSVQHLDHYAFDSNTGLMSSHTDWNGNATTYSYVNSNTGSLDPLNRLGQVTYPATTDGTTGNSGQGYKKYFYTDSPGSLAVAEQDLQSTSGVTVSRTTEFDGLGRVIHALSTSDPYGTVTVDTNYDSLGRVASVSNPYRSTSDPTYGITSYAYDALSRKVIQTQSDGSSILQWCYNGIETNGQSNCHSNASSMTGIWVNSADENGNDWQQVSDGLGRLEAAVEPNGTSATPSMVTKYAYDANDNLLSSTQLGNGTGSVSRSFAYDSLSRLVASDNPENASAANPPSLTCPGAGSTYWTTCYGYDANGNLTSKKDNRSVTISYSYDALNRLQWKHYSDGVTIAAGFGYDGLDPTGNQISGETNANGRLSQTSEVTAKAISILSYDAMGRVLKKESCIPGDCSYDVKVNATYDLAGNLASLSNGSPTQPITLSYRYDAVNRLASLTSNWTSGSNHPAALFEANSSSPASYGPTGLQYALMGATTSSAATVVLNRAYDKRLRVIYEGDANHAGTVLYSYCIPETNNSYCTASSSGYFPNGNLQQVSDSVMGEWTFQSPGYDTLNRLANGSASGGPYNGQYGCWQYDPFGNRTSEAVSTTNCPQNPTPTSWAHYNSDNQITGTGLMPNGYLYDAAGNVLNDGVNQYLYDGEERICAVKSATGAMTGYIYDAAGDRFAKGTITTFSCNLSSNGFTTTSGYVVGLNGEQLTETNGGTGWVHTHVLANGKLLATYTSTDTLFELNDWLGTRRADAGASGCLTLWVSLWWGNALSSEGSNFCSDSSELHFTGKARDTESGNDYFRARYYASSMGRFLSPDWAAVAEPVPYAKLGDPQTLNMYAYVGNNPLNRTDPDGHCSADGEQHGFWWCVGHFFGLQETQKEYDTKISTERQWLVDNVANDTDEKDALAGASSKSIDNLYKAWDQAIQAAQCNWITGCAEGPNQGPLPAADFARDAAGAFVLYRGGSSFDPRPGEFKIDADGTVKTSRGVSVNTDPTKVEKYGGAHEITSMPSELQALQVGRDPGHFEIVPRQPGMQPSDYIELLRSIVTEAPKEP